MKLDAQISKEDLQRAASRVGGELQGLRQSLREKGAKYFQRPLALGGVVLFAAYFYAYQSTAETKIRVENELAAAKAIAQHGERYKDLKSQLDEFQDRIPKNSQPERWLEQETRDTLRLEGIVPLNISTPKETVREELRFISITVSCQASFRQIASWIARIERGKNLMYIEIMTLKKDELRIGENLAELKITTIAAKTAEAG